MKKFMNIMLAVALTAGLATITVAQDPPKTEDKKTGKTGKKGKAKKGGDAKDGKDAPKGKGKGKKAKDDKADTK